MHDRKYLVVSVVVSVVFSVVLPPTSGVTGGVVVVVSVVVVFRLTCYLAVLGLSCRRLGRFSLVPFLLSQPIANTPSAATKRMPDSDYRNTLSAEIVVASSAAGTIPATGVRSNTIDTFRRVFCAPDRYDHARVFSITAG